MVEATDSPARAAKGPIPARPFRIADALILIAALAVGAAMARPPFVSLFVWKARGDIPPPASLLPSFLAYLSAVIYPVVAAVTIALIAIQLMPPRSSCRRLAREPGMAACLAAAIVLTLALFQSIPVTRLYPDEWSRTNWLPEVWIMASRQCGFAVMGAWSTLGFSGSWRPTRDWLDRMGRILGIAWIGAVALNFASTLWNYAFYW